VVYFCCGRSFVFSSPVTVPGFAPHSFPEGGQFAFFVNGPPPPLDGKSFHRRSHKEVEYQQRKTWENCDALSPLSSIGGESADGGSALTRVFWSRQQILSREASFDSSRLRLKTLVHQIHSGPVFELPADSGAHEPPRLHRRMSRPAQARADIPRKCFSPWKFRR